MKLSKIIIIFLVALVSVIAFYVASIYGLYHLFVWFGAPKWIAIMGAVGIMVIGGTIGNRNKE